MSKFLIPKNVSTRLEFFSGFGWRELYLVLIGLGVGGLLFLLTFLITHSFYSIAFVGAGAGIGFFLGKPDPRTRKNALDFFRDYQAFNRRAKRYYYRHGEGRSS